MENKDLDRDEKRDPKETRQEEPAKISLAFLIGLIGVMFVALALVIWLLWPEKKQAAGDFAEKSPAESSSEYKEGADEISNDLATGKNLGGDSQGDFVGEEPTLPQASAEAEPEEGSEAECPDTDSEPEDTENIEDFQYSSDGSGALNSAILVTVYAMSEQDDSARAVNISSGKIQLKTKTAYRVEMDCRKLFAAHEDWDGKKVERQIKLTDQVGPENRGFLELSVIDPDTESERIYGGFVELNSKKDVKLYVQLSGGRKKIADFDLRNESVVFYLYVSPTEES